MMAEIKCLTEELEKLRKQIKRVMDVSHYREYDDLSGVTYDKRNAEEMFLINEYRGILQKLDSVEYILEYLGLPVNFEDTLVKSESGRYETRNGRFTYTCGSGIEFLDTEEQYDVDEDEVKDVPCWRASSVEHNGKDYYIVGFPSVVLDGLKVRVRVGRR